MYDVGKEASDNAWGANKESDQGAYVSVQVS
jgi:hypothetical protein